MDVSQNMGGINETEFDDQFLFHDLSFSLQDGPLPSLEFAMGDMDRPNSTDPDEQAKNRKDVSYQESRTTHVNGTSTHISEYDFNGNGSSEAEMNGNTQPQDLNAKDQADWMNKVNELGEPLEIVEELAEILNTKLSRNSIYCAYKLLQAGADYRVLADVVKKWRKVNLGKPRRRLGHYFEPQEETVPKKQDWVW